MLLKDYLQHMVKFKTHVSFHLYISFIGIYLSCAFEQMHKGVDGNIVVISKRRGKKTRKDPNSH